MLDDLILAIPSGTRSINRLTIGLLDPGRLPGVSDHLKDSVGTAK